MTDEELAHLPTVSTKHMTYEERLEGIRQMMTDLDTLARADGCIAAAWAHEFIRAAPLFGVARYRRVE